MTNSRVIVIMVGGLCWLCTQLPTSAAHRPNVLIIMTDDQGTLDANCFGSTDLHTPHIDRLAAHGVRFTQAYAHTVCCPARAALMTGRHPQRGNVNTWMQSDLRGPDGENMNLDEVTLVSERCQEPFFCFFGRHVFDPPCQCVKAGLRPPRKSCGVCGTVKELVRSFECVPPQSTLSESNHES